MRSGTRTLAARYIFPVEGPPIEGGLLTVEDGRIGRVGPVEGRRYDLDLGNVAILPGFVNAHTHLELSPIPPPAPPDGPEDEVAWLARVVAQQPAIPFSLEASWTEGRGGSTSGALNLHGLTAQEWKALPTLLLSRRMQSVRITPGQPDHSNSPLLQLLRTELPKVTPFTLAKGAAKPNANDRCPCGSGQKYKRCHGA